MSAVDDQRAPILADLAKSRAFAHLPRHIFEHIVALTKNRQYPPGALILQEGLANSSVYLLTKGSVSVYSAGMLVGRYGRAGDTFGEMSVVSGSPASATVMANDNVEVLVLDASLLSGLRSGTNNELEVLFKLFAFSLLEKLRLTTLKARLAEDTILRTEPLSAVDTETGAGAKAAAKQLDDILLVSRGVSRVDSAIVVMDSGGHVARMNLAAERMLGCPEIQVAGRPVEELFESGNHGEVLTRLLKGDISRWEGECELRKHGSQTFPAKVSISAILDAQDNRIGALLMIDDLTEWTKLQKKLEHAQKLEVAGRMASGIAHDLNNLLQPIIGFAQLSLEQTPAGMPLHGDLQMIVKASQQAADLVSQFLLFSGRSRMTPLRLSVRSLLDESLPLVRAMLPPQIAIQQRVAEGLPDILADKTQLWRVLENLVSNAGHAMAGQGSLLLSADAVVLDNMPDRFATALSGHYVRWAISDTGVGIEPEVLERMWDPFFTTRKPGEGTGLGLALVSEIVKQHKGGIQVRSTPGQGTTFEIYLPAADPGSAPAAPADAAPDPARGGQILFVDDEESVCSLVKTVLERAGYSVHTETRSLPALDLFRTRPAAFDLVITDLTMPQMRGDELARKLRETRPKIPIILCTGNADAQQATDYDAVIYKPISPRQLCVFVRRTLDQRGTVR